MINTESVDTHKPTTPPNKQIILDLLRGGSRIDIRILLPLVVVGGLVQL
jgi:hypothetical protein